MCSFVLSLKNWILWWYRGPAGAYAYREPLRMNSANSVTTFTHQEGSEVVVWGSVVSKLQLLVVKMMNKPG